MLITIPGFLSRHEAQELRQRLLQGEWRDGARSAGAVAARVKQNLQLDDGSELAAATRHALLSRLQQHPLFVSAALPARIYPPKFNRYRDGGHYGLHVDSAVMQLPDGPMRTDLSATLFLSDPGAYDGGELVIESQFGAQQVKLPAGELVLYPSSSLHEVTPVTRGERLASFFWVQSMVRSSFQREQLFELDQSIQMLTGRLGLDDGEVKRLNGIYHNLLRGWAEL